MAKRSLAQRSGRQFPHNAIYEILTHGIPLTMRSEPKCYSKRTINEFWKMLENTSVLTRRAYELVYANDNTLVEAGKIMKVSPSTVKKYLMNIYFVKDDMGYMVAGLDEVSKTSMDGNGKVTRGKSLEQIIWFVNNHLPLTKLNKSQARNVLTAYCEDVTVGAIAGFYKYPIEDCITITKAYEDMCFSVADKKRREHSKMNYVCSFISKMLGYDESTVQVVISSYLKGIATNKISDKYNIPMSTVADIVRNYEREVF